MNRKDVIRMAREQGFPETEVEGVFRVNSDDLGRLLAAEREECAKVCDLEFAACWHADALSQAKEAKRCAAAIRARSYHFRDATKMMDGEQ